LNSKIQFFDQTPGTQIKPNVNMGRRMITLRNAMLTVIWIFSIKHSTAQTYCFNLTKEIELIKQLPESLKQVIMENIVSYQKTLQTESIKPKSTTEEDGSGIKAEIANDTSNVENTTVPTSQRKKEILSKPLLFSFKMPNVAFSFKEAVAYCHNKVARLIEPTETYIDALNELSIEKFWVQINELTHTYASSEPIPEANTFEIPTNQDKTKSCLAFSTKTNPHFVWENCAETYTIVCTFTDQAEYAHNKAKFNKRILKKIELNLVSAHTKILQINNPKCPDGNIQPIQQLLINQTYLTGTINLVKSIDMIKTQGLYAYHFNRLIKTLLKIETFAKRLANQQIPKQLRFAMQTKSQRILRSEWRMSFDENKNTICLCPGKTILSANPAYIYIMITVSIILALSTCLALFLSGLTFRKTHKKIKTGINTIEVTQQNLLKTTQLPNVVRPKLTKSVSFQLVPYDQIQRSKPPPYDLVSTTSSEDNCEQLSNLLMKSNYIRQIKL